MSEIRRETEGSSYLFNSHLASLGRPVPMRPLSLRDEENQANLDDGLTVVACCSSEFFLLGATANVLIDDRFPSTRLGPERQTVRRKRCLPAGGPALAALSSFRGDSPAGRATAEWRGGLGRRVLGAHSQPGKLLCAGPGWGERIKLLSIAKGR